MRVSKDTQIAGIPATELRRAFRHLRNRNYARINELRAVVGEQLGLTVAQRKALVAQLIAEGYIEQRRLGYELSDSGLRLAAASTGKPIPRDKAEQLLAEFIERARSINQGDTWYRVAQIELFGSLLDPSRETVNDIDLMVTLEPRYHAADSQEMLLAMNQYKKVRAGRSGADLMDLLNFPADEVLRQLKAGKRAYQLLSELEHTDMRARTACTVVFAEHAEPIALPEALR